MTMRRSLVVSVFVVLLTAVVCARQRFPSTINIGGIFESKNDKLSRAFDFALSRSSLRSRNPLERSLLNGVKETVHDAKWSFSTYGAACRMLPNGLSAIIGPTKASSGPVLDSLCSSYNLPFISIGPQLTPSIEPGELPKRINLHPATDVLSKAFFDIANMTDWKTISVIYDSEDSLIRLAYLLREAASVTYLHHVHDYNSPVTLFKRIYHLKDNNIIIDVDTPLIPVLLGAARSAGMMTEYYNFVLTSLDVHTLDLSPYYPLRANISYVSLIDLNNKENARVAKEFRLFQLSDGIRDSLELTTEQALVVDSVSFAVRTLQEMSLNHNIEGPEFDCNFGGVWRLGSNITERMLRSSFRGLTGVSVLSDNGMRESFQLEIMRILSTGPTKVALWDTESGIRVQSSYPENVKKELENLMASKIFNVTTILNAPYTMLKKDHASRTGNDRFEGFCMELMQTLSERVGFKYTVELVKDNNYGNRQPDGSFNGMIKEVMNMEADMAIVDLSITAERMEVVDFTQPFLRTGISILFKKQAQQADVSYFLFMKPFSLEVWICTLTAFIGITVFYYITASISPDENAAVAIDVELKDYPRMVLDQEMKIASRFWFAIGSIMQQGSDLNPMSFSCRTIASIWWFFTLIVVSSYTANLAATLTAERMVSQIDSADDLARQTDIKYGCLASGSSRKFFEQSTNKIYQQLSDVMARAKPSVYAKTNDEAIRRVLGGKYAYFMEATTIEYLKERDCRLTKVGGLLDSKGYGIATPMGSPLRKLLSEEILKLAESDYFITLKQKWWKSDRPCPAVAPPSEEMGMAELVGVFLVLLFGCVVGIIMMFGEFLWEATYIPFGERSFLVLELWWAFRFALWGDDKRPRPESMERYFISSKPKEKSRQLALEYPAADTEL